MQRLAPRLHSAAAAIALCAALLHPASGVAQQANPGPLAPVSAPEPTLQAATASPELAQTLQHLSEAAQNLNKSLPSITCTETGVSEALKHTRVKRRVKFTATLRAVRTPDAGLHESFTLTRINGKPYSRPGYPFPFYTKGGFESALAYFLPRQQPCLVYTLSPGRIDFVTAPDAASRPPCRADGVHGFALLDREGNVTHIERRVPEQSTQDFNLTPFASIDFAPVELNGHTFRLSHHVVSEVNDGTFTGRFEVTYSGCQLYTATVKILPATQLTPAIPDTPDTPDTPQP